MKRYTSIILLMLFIITPMHGMKRSCDVENYGVSEDAWHCLVPFLGVSQLKILARVTTAFNILVNNFLKPDPTRMDQSERKRELLVALQKQDLIRASLLLSCLPEGVLSRTTHRYVGAACGILGYQRELLKRKALNTQNRKEAEQAHAQKKKLNDFGHTVFASNWQKKFKKTALRHAVVLKQRWEKMPLQDSNKEFEEVKQIYLTKTEYSLSDFFEFMQESLNVAVIHNNEEVVTKFLSLDVFTSYFAQTDCPITFQYCAELMFDARHYASPAIVSCCMKWILASRLSLEEKSKIYQANMVQCVVINRPDHMDALMQIPDSASYMQAFEKVNLLFCLAFVQGKKECLNKLLKRGTEDSARSEPDAMYTDKKCIALVLDDIARFSELDELQNIIEDCNLDLLKDFAQNPIFEKFICEWITQYFNSTKTLDDKDKMFFTVLTHSLCSTFAEKVADALFADVYITQFRSISNETFITGLGECIIDENLVLEMRLRSTLLARMQYWALVLKKHEHLISLAEKKPLELSMATAVLDDWIEEKKGMEFSDHQRSIFCVVLPSGAPLHVLQYQKDEYTKALQALKNISMQEKLHLRHCSLHYPINYSRFSFESKSTVSIQQFCESDRLEVFRQEQKDMVRGEFSNLLDNMNSDQIEETIPKLRFIIASCMTQSDKKWALELAQSKVTTLQSPAAKFEVEYIIDQLRFNDEY